MTTMILFSGDGLRRTFRVVGLGIACLLAMAGAARAQTWIGTTGGEWNLSSNWNPASVPNATDATATFSGSATVNLTSFTATVGTLQLTAANSIAIGTTASTSDGITLAKSSGTPTINAAASGAIFMYATITGSQGFEKTGAGRLTWRFNEAAQTFSGNILITAGSLGINANNSLGNDDNDITIATGARLLAEPGSNTGTITLPATRTITLSGAQSQIGASPAAVNLVIQGPVGETGTGQGLVKTDAGTVTLQGTLSYTGETRIAGGTLALAGSALLPATQNLRFNQTTGTLDVGSTNQTVRTIVLDNTGGNKSITGAGGSLLVNGNASLQLSGSNGVTYDLSGLGSFAFDRSNQSFSIQGINAAGVTSIVDMNLARGGPGGGTNTITGTSILVGAAALSDGNSGSQARLHLGTSNTFRAASFQVGGFNAGGTVDFQAGLTNPSLTLRGTDGTSAMTTWTIGETSSGARTGQGVVNLTGGSLDAVVTDVRIGRHLANATNADSSTLTMPAGTLTASTLAMAVKTGSGTPTLTSTMNQSGGTASIGTITLGDGGAQAAVLVPTYNLTGGSLAATTIGAGAGTSYNTTSTVRTLNVNGGTVRNRTGTNLTINGLDTTSSGRINLAIGASGGVFEADAGQSITVGANTAVTGAGGLTKTGAGTLIVATTAAYAGATTVSDGTLAVNGALSTTSGLSTAAGTTLGGSGSVAAAIAGAGRIGPGNSAGILTATSADVSTGLDFDFEFTQAGVNPTWSASTASVNDVLRLTNSSGPFSGALGATNTVNVWLDVASLTQGDTFTGGWFTDRSTDFTSEIQDATFVYYVRGDGNGTAGTYAGTSYYTLAQVDPTLSVDAAALLVGSANFSSGTVTNGYATQFSVVPEPGSLAALGLMVGGLAGLLVSRRRRRSAI